MSSRDFTRVEQFFEALLGSWVHSTRKSDSKRSDRSSSPKASV